MFALLSNSLLVTLIRQYMVYFNISIYIALVSLWCHSNKEKNQEYLDNGIMRALEITNQNNLLTIAFPQLGNGIFDFSTDLCAIIMLQRTRGFITKNSNSLLKLGTHLGFKWVVQVLFDLKPQ